MTTKVFDTFTGTSGDDIDTHTPDTDVVGGGWIDSGANEVELDGIGGLKFSGGGTECWIDCGTVDQWATVNLQCASGSGVSNDLYITLRRDSAVRGSETSYFVTFEPNTSGGKIVIAKRIAGSRTDLALNTAISLDSNVSYTCSPEVNGAALDFIIDGTSELSITDSSVTTGGYAGALHSIRANDTLRVFDFQIDDTAPSVGVSIPVFINHYRNQGIS